MTKLAQPIGVWRENQIFDLQTASNLKLDGEAIYYDNSLRSLELIRHSCAHLMAEAITKLYTNAKFFVGPTVEEGFYYDFKVDEKISDEDLAKIENQMRQIAEKKRSLNKYFIEKKEALEKFKNDELKLEVLEKITDERVSIYEQGDFEDLCKGPHVPNMGFVNHFKLLKVAGAYVGGDDSRPMLIRIYGIAFADAKSLRQHLKMLEEAKKRDHKKLGTKLNLFKFYESVGSGFAVWLPNGAKLKAKLENILFRLHQIKGYEPVQGPQMLKADLWKTSGHYENYQEFMYNVKVDDQEFCIKPMNCLGHIKVFESDLRSYKDLPLRFFEFGAVHRHEKSGVLNGLFRTRGFTQDDAHIFCRPDQIQDEIFSVLDFLSALMKVFDFDYSIELATRPSKFVGSDAIWQTATKAIEDALKAKQLDYDTDEGGGAFYGPKIDIKITDAIGRKWQCGTVQLDFNLPARFNISYVDQNNSKVTPVMLHRALLGSFERFIGILIEHYAAEFPFFIAPNQVDIIPISEDHQNYAKSIFSALSSLNIDARILDKNESLNKRIRFAETSKTPILVIIGDRELKDQTVAVRNRRKKLKTQTTLKEFLDMVKTMTAINLAKPSTNNKKIIMNQDITVSEVRCMAEDGKEIGIISRIAAFNMAQQEGLDLVLIAPQAKPPVAKIMDYGKYRYQQEKRAKEAKKKQKNVQVKEIKLTIKIAENDLNYKIKHAINFLEAEKHVKFRVFLKGREIANSNSGIKLLEKVIDIIGEVATVERSPFTEGRFVNMYLVPTKKKK